eukprot:CAMPEP_0117423714 /NCGR_PEP_ID=MMETSP0758-20121206/4274_1 /TAXON_ID=63605 /ORGANISM="Percolomonas cosmopolitus, Strain AE-1 (ATCC 50343)" /LENGTH=603 /DNA_ID=CAMNT_0005207051 /DNA_START=6 /DNA_END=1817 /DNA_ORIENTATION=+
MNNNKGDTKNPQEEEKKKEKVWLDGWYDPLAGVCAAKSCMCYADIRGDGDYKLVIANSATNPLLQTASQITEHKIKIYSKTNVISEHVLEEEPVAICSFYVDYNSNRKPVLAVACGTNVYIYKNMQPFFKFTTPLENVNEEEKLVWEALVEGKMDVLNAAQQLHEMSENGTNLTKRSFEYLSLTANFANDQEGAKAELSKFIEERRAFPLEHSSAITCMTVLKKDKDEPDALGCLVVGTESGRVIILSPQVNNVLKSIVLPSPAVCMTATGNFDVDYRVIIACRNGNVYTVKNSELSGVVIELDSQPTDVLKIDKQIIIATMNNTIHCYSRGKKQYSIYTPSTIKHMEILDMQGFRNVKCLIVALENKDLLVYHQKTLINKVSTINRVCGLLFGIYGSEPNTLALTYANGGLEFKFVARKAKLEVSASTGPPPEQNIPLKLPTRTTLYLEHMEREKEYATEMHRIFQRELCKFRLTTAKAFVKILTDGQGNLSMSSGSQIRLNAQVQGLGPHFKIFLNLQNSGARPVYNIPVLFRYKQSIYSLDKSMLIVPVLLPNLNYKYVVNVVNRDPEEGPDTINIFVCGSSSSVPLITAIVNMPVGMAI